MVKATGCEGMEDKESKVEGNEVEEVVDYEIEDEIEDYEI